jgi:hypothetical protein
VNVLRFQCPPWLIAVFLTSGSIFADDAVLSADFSVQRGVIRRLHGINKGPLAPGGIFEVIKEQKELGVPFTRLHDCGWPNTHTSSITTQFSQTQARIRHCLRATTFD